MQVRDIMQNPVEVLRRDATLREAAFLFRRQKVLGAQVVDKDGGLKGIFTHDELLQALANGASMAEPVARHMRSVFCTVHPDADITGIDWQGCRFLAVIDDGEVVGGVDTMAVLEALYGVRKAEGETACQEIFQGLPEPLFIVDNDWTVVWYNVAAGLACTKAGKSLCGQRLSDLLVRAGFNLEVDPDDEQSIHMASKDSVRLLPIIWRASQEDIHAGRVVLLRNVLDQMLCFRELTDLRHMSKELHAIINSSFDGFYITDGEGRTLYVNRAYERITGIRAKEVIGQYMHDLVNGGFYDESVTIRVLQTKRTETIIQRIKNTKTIVVTGNPIFDHEGNIWRVVTNVRDVTELRKLQVELERMASLQDHYRMELDSLRRHMDHKSKIIIRSKRMQEIYEQAMHLAQVDSTVLITGESGVGKEVVAELIHTSSARQEHPFIKLSCAAIPEQLLESELFGYTPGAFTGALRTGKRGLFEVAHQGSLFLDEIGEMPMGLQAKMLRVLQDKTFTRVGGDQEIQVDVRIIAATNRNLEEMVSHKLFRSDLYYRLNVVPVVIPPLRDRREAVFDFIYLFLGRFNQKHGLSKQIEADALDVLTNMDWPGNVRELENSVERLVVMSRGDVITRDEVFRALKLTDPSHGLEPARTHADLPLKDILERTERAALKFALKKHQSTRAIAKALGVNQSTVVRKLRRYGLKAE